MMWSDTHINPIPLVLRKIALVAILLTTSFITQGQEINATAKLDTNVIFVGDQINFTLSVEHNKDQDIQWPIFNDTISKMVVIVKESLIDSVTNEDLITQTKQYLITSFDSGFHVIPPIQFKLVAPEEGIETSTEPLLLTVNLIDLLPDEDIRDIKPIIDVPITWMELLKRYKNLLIIIGLCLLTLVILFFVWRYFKKKPKKEQTPEKIVIPKIPPAVTALDELNKLKESKSWLNKTTKPYFSDLTDILRIYIEGIFHINAMEMTTNEILSCFDRIQISEESKTKLTYILKLADGVKFAKQKPMVNECEICLTNGFDFVNDTKPTETIQKEEEEEKIDKT